MSSIPETLFPSAFHTTVARDLRRLALIGGALLGGMLSPSAFAYDVSDANEAWKSEENRPANERGDQRVIGRVAGLRGTVYAQTPGQPRRLLVEDAPIYPGDRLVSSKGAQLGVLGGDYYTGLNEDTVLTFEKQGRGAPQVRLERGDVRVINTGNGNNARNAWRSTCRPMPSNAVARATSTCASPGVPAMCGAEPNRLCQARSMCGAGISLRARSYSARGDCGAGAVACVVISGTSKAASGSKPGIRAGSHAAGRRFPARGRRVSTP